MKTKDDACMAIVLEDPNCNVEFPSDLAALNDNEPSVFYLRFQENGAPLCYLNAATSSLRLDYVAVNETDTESRCWRLLCWTKCDADHHWKTLMQSDETALWPVSHSGFTGVEHYWQASLDKILEKVKFAEHKKT